jgi:iron complex outermembrane receptor protein
MQVCGVSLLALHAHAAVTSADLADLTVEQLMNESVTSVSKKETSLGTSPAAVSVITDDDIRRLGITSIPEALRLVPGLDVARIGANQWAISARGFNLQYANKLLVLVDGRSVYTPSFGGVYWDSQDTILEDLDRIEVIRGPGATLWGANAVNGVINITTKSAKETQGGLVSLSGGTEDQPSVGVRYGGAVGSDLHYRTYVKYFNRDGLLDPDGNATPDDWESIRAGFRADWEPNGDDLVTIQGDIYALGTGEKITTPTFTPPYAETSAVDNSSHGGNLLGRWTRTLSETSQFSIQAYFDTFRHSTGVTDESRQTADLQLEHRFAAGTWNEIVWGLGYRFTQDDFNDSAINLWSPSSTDLNLYSGFLQDEITLVPDRLRLTLGSKFEHNDFTGWEVQPGAQLMWTPTGKQTVWLSVMRAAGTPSRLYRDARVNLAVVQPPGSPPIEAAWVGNSGFISETVDAFELGYRVEPATNLSLDVATFYNIYDNLLGVEMGAPQVEGSHLMIPYNFANNESGSSYGAEATVEWKPLESWRLTANYTWLQMELHPSGTLGRGSPEQQFSLRSYVDLPWDLEFNAFASYTDSIESLNKTGTTTPIPSHIRFDAGLIWHASDNLEIGLWGQNLLDSQHPEFSSQNTTAITEIPRSVVGKVTWRF